MLLLARAPLRYYRCHWQKERGLDGAVNICLDLRDKGLAYGIVSVLGGTDRDARCFNFQRRKCLLLSHVIL